MLLSREAMEGFGYPPPPRVTRAQGFGLGWPFVTEQYTKQVAIGKQKLIINSKNYKI